MHERLGVCIIAAINTDISTTWRPILKEDGGFIVCSHNYNIISSFRDSSMEFEEEEFFPVSPTGQYFNSSVLSIGVIGVLESEVPIDDSQTIPLINDLFLPINPRFSSIMVIDENGDKQWKKVEVKPKNHIKVAIFPEGKSPSFYDDCFNDYISKVAMEPFPPSRPLWEIHIFKYPTTNAAGNLIFKLHHALGDGFSLMGALLSCLQRADDPSLPLTFPAFKEPKIGNDGEEGFCKSVPRLFSGIFNTISDFGWSLMKSTFLEDDRTPIRSGDDGVEFRPIDVTTVSFSIDRIKQIKVKLEVTINDVICGVIFLGTRLYMEATNQEQKNGNATALVLLNTRNIGGYKSTKEMVQPNMESKWGNQFAFMHVSVPELAHNTNTSNALHFVSKAQEIIHRKRNSSAVFLTGKVLDALRRHQSPEATAKFVHSTLKNSSMTVSNMIGPIEKLALANHPVKGMYFMVVGVPQSLTITMVSYMKNLRVAVGTERGLINPQKYKDCIQCAFDMIFDAALGSGVQENAFSNL